MLPVSELQPTCCGVTSPRRLPLKHSEQLFANLPTKPVVPSHATRLLSLPPSFLSRAPTQCGYEPFCHISALAGGGWCSDDEFGPRHYPLFGATEPGFAAAFGMCTSACRHMALLATRYSPSTKPRERSLTAGYGYHCKENEHTEEDSSAVSGLRCRQI